MNFDIKNAFLSLFCLFLFIKTSAQHSAGSTRFIYTFEKKAHFSKPRNLLKRNIKVADTLRWESSFEPSCCYFITDKNGKMDVDQWDYNKLTGIAFNNFNPLANTAMIGWRHNPNTELIELTPYWHVQKQRFFNEKQFLTVQPNERFIVEIITNKEKKEVEICIKTSKDILKDTKTFKAIPKTATLIQPYFGGTSKAPCDMKLYLKRLK